MKNFLYFLLGFFVVSALLLSTAGAAIQQFSLNYANCGPLQFQQSGRQVHNYVRYDRNNGQFTSYNLSVSYYWQSCDLVKIDSCTQIPESLGTVEIGNSINWAPVAVAPTKICCPAGQEDVNGVCTVVCNPPKAINPYGQCVDCPSGVFLITGYCVPTCDYSNAYVPGELYNPPNGTGTCVMPPCGPGQTTNSEGRCVPNCPEGKKIDATNGTCVLDCYYGTHEENGQCVNDCLPGYMVDAETGSCIEERGCLSGEQMCHGLCMSSCLPGETRNLKDCTCTSPAPKCPFGQHEENGVCVATPVSCPPGSHFDQATHTCKTDPLETETDETKITNPDGTITTVHNEYITVSDGNGGTISGTVTRTTTSNPATGGSSSSTSFTPPNIEKYESPEHTLDWSGWNSQASRFANEGPLKVLKVIKGYIDALDVEPEAPSFDFVVWGHHFNVNLSAFDPLAQAVRFFLSVGLTIGFGWFIYRLFGVA